MTRESADWIRWVPNGLSVGRLLLAAVFPWTPGAWRLPAVLLGALTDLADGQIARRFRITSVGGGILDAVADKLFVLSVLGTLTHEGVFTLLQACLVLSRDLTVVAIALYAASRRETELFRQMPSRLAGKTATAGQFALFAVALAPWEAAIGPVLLLAILGSVAAAIDYLVQLALALRAERRER